MRKMITNPDPIVPKTVFKEGSQQVIVQGKFSSVIISGDECGAMKNQRPDFVHFMRTSPLAGMELDIFRSDLSVRNLEAINPQEQG